MTADTDIQSAPEQNVTGEAVVSIRQLTKTYDTEDGEKKALDGINLDVEAGDVFGIIGLSGAGKSTLVRCINGLEGFDSGEVLVEGQSIAALKPKELRGVRKRVSMIFQSFNLMPSRTVRGNVEYPLKGIGLSKQKRNERVDELLGLVGLEEKAASYPSELSGGQKQRVAIARALANNPQILLSDEATSALDPTTTKSILALLKSLQKKLNLTIVLITHEMSVIKQVCNKVAVIEHGVIVEEGSVFDVFSNPQAELTKAFIATTSNLEKVQDLIETHSPLTQLASGQQIIRLRYLTRGVSEPLVSEISRKFDINVNILFGDIDVVEDAPLGGIVAVVDGPAQKVFEAIEFLRERDISVETIDVAKVGV